MPLCSPIAVWITLAKNQNIFGKCFTNPSGKLVKANQALLQTTNDTHFTIISRKTGKAVHEYKCSPNPIWKTQCCVCSWVEHDTVGLFGMVLTLIWLAFAIFGMSSGVFFVHELFMEKYGAANYDWDSPVLKVVIGKVFWICKRVILEMNFLKFCIKGTKDSDFIKTSLSKVRDTIGLVKTKDKFVRKITNQMHGVQILWTVLGQKSSRICKAQSQMRTNVTQLVRYSNILPTKSSKI